MKKMLTLVMAALLSLTAFAQQPTTVKGVVLDSLTRVGEPAAILQFFRLPDLEKAVAFTTTDEEGNFSHSFTLAGDYVLVFDNLGRQVQRRSFTVPADTEVVDLGEILAQDSAETLKAGTVTAMRPLVKMEVDKMTYNVEDDVDAKTATVLDMLRKVPMVTVDGQDNISVNGSSSFQVYVDGKPNQMLSQNASTIFKVMPASSVKSIEVVTNPGVKYDAEGVGGVLNITTNKGATGGASVADGFYGTATGMLSTRGYGGSLALSMQKGKFAMSTTVTAMDNRMKNTSVDIERTQSSGFRMNNSTVTDMKIPIAMVNQSASYEIDSLNLVSATLGVMHLGTRMDSGLTSTLIAYPGADPIGYTGTTAGLNTSNELSFSADYQHLWAGTPGRSLVLSYQFNGEPTENSSLNTFNAASVAGFDLTDRKSEGLTGSYDNTFQADFTTPLGSLHTLSSGAKLLLRHNFSDQKDYLWDGSDYVLNPLSSLQYTFNSQIGAVYTELEGKYGSVGVKAGVRYEHTWQDYSAGNIDPFRVDYGNLVPSASVQWSPSMTQNIGLSYNMRISRPGITYLNPYVNTSDPTALTYGNTSLDAERGHNLSLVYNFYSPQVIVSATLRHSFSNNGISSYSFYDGNNLLNTTYGNIVSSRSTGLNGYVMWMPGSKTRIMLNGGAGYDVLRSEQLGQQNDGFTYNLMLAVQQTLPWDLRASANLISMGRSVTLQGWSTGMNMGVLGLTKTFLDDRLSVSLSGILPLAKDFNLAMESYSEGKDFTTRTVTQVPMKAVTLQLSWTFGKQGNYSAKKARRSIENDAQLNSASTAESMGGILQM
ncbi:MAG: TonB-dependent receptor [Bacteroidales bacterium]|nr:TonB-dependent receptor [Bacteroidales bacterium]